MKRPKARTGARSWMAALPLVMALILLLVACCNPARKAPSPGALSGGALDAGVKGGATEQEPGQELLVTLADAEPAPGPAKELSTPSGLLPLDSARLDELLGRLPPMEAPEQPDPDLPVIRADSPPPPRPGKELTVAFPPTGQQQDQADGAPDPGVSGQVLTLLRRAPQGQVSLVPRLSVTFSQPMVELGSHENAAARVPLVLEPELPGRWRWLGSSTLLFEPRQGFPMATEYRVTVPAGTSAATGAVLGQQVQWTFSTTPPTVEQVWPRGGPHGLEPLLFLAFDQRIDPRRVLRHVSLSAEDGQVPLRLASTEQVRADAKVGALVDAAKEGRWLAFYPVKPLQSDSSYELLVSAGTPSEEGPLVSVQDQSFSFYTYPPFQVRSHGCSAGDRCPPDSDWYVRFNNPLEEASFDASAITVEPPLEDMEVHILARSLRISGLARSSTDYTLSLPASLQDTFGQSLSGTEPLVFHVGLSRPWLKAPGDLFVVLQADSGAAPALPVYSLGHDLLKLELRGLEPGDWPAFVEWARALGSRGSSRLDVQPPGEKLAERQIRVSTPDGDARQVYQQAVETAIPLDLSSGYSNFAVLVEPAKPGAEPSRQRVLRWVQVSDLDLAAYADARNLLAWVAELDDGTPVEGATVSLVPPGESATTDPHGLARVALPEQGEQPQMLVARKDGRMACLPQNSSRWSSGAGWLARQEQDRLIWMVLDDRGIYRPGEQAQIRGWVRVAENRERGGPRGVGPSPFGVDWTLRGPRGQVLDQGSQESDPLEGFHLEISLPPDMHTGTAWLEMKAVDTSIAEPAIFRHPIKVQEFRKPEFSVDVQVEPGPHGPGEPFVARVAATGLSGGPLGGAALKWRVFGTETSYAPPGWGAYSFGSFKPRFRIMDALPPGRPVEEELASWEATTDSHGRHTLLLSPRFRLPQQPGVPVKIRAEATVRGATGQTWSDSASTILHPASVYLGLRTERRLSAVGQELDVDLVAVDVDGKTVEGLTITAELSRLAWTRDKGQWSQQRQDTITCQKQSGPQPVTCTFRPPRPGAWEIKTRLRDSAGRLAQSSLSLWVTSTDMPAHRGLQARQLELIPDSDRYQPGETARLLVQAPFWPASGMLRIERSGLLETRSFSLDGPATTLELPVLESYLPGVHVQVDLLGATDGPAGSTEPAMASGSALLSVSRASRGLELLVSPAVDHLEPGQDTRIDLLVTDSDHRAVQAVVALWVVDEAVLDLVDYQVPDPLQVFYPVRPSGVQEAFLLPHLLLPRQEDLQGAASLGESAEEPPPREGRTVMAMARGGSTGDPSLPPPAAKAMDDGALGASAQPEAESPKTRLRQFFDALALFEPALRTGPDGRASVDLHLPDSLTRYRIMAVAISGERYFGKGEASLTASKALMAIPSPPRFLNTGDQAQIPVLLRNRTSGSVQVEVAMRAVNARLAVDAERPVVESGQVAFTDRAGFSLALAPEQSVAVPFPVSTALPGQARFQVLVSGGGKTDAASFRLPVWTPATTESFASYGELDGGDSLSQPVLVPSGAWSGFGGLELGFSSTQLQSLADAVLYLVSYPYEYAEQLASRVLAVSASRPMLRAFASANLPDEQELERQVYRDLEKLISLQNPDGGFGFYKAGDRSSPFVSIHVAHAMARAREAGFHVSQRASRNVLRYMDSLDRRIPAGYPGAATVALKAYALSVSMLMGPPDFDAAAALVDDNPPGDLSAEAIAWLLPVLRQGGMDQRVDGLLRELGNRVVETAASARIATGHDESDTLLLRSDRRTDALVLDALLAVEPGSVLIPSLVHGILEQRQAGRWSTTQENVFVLLALEHYFKVHETQEPDLVARAWLGDSLVVEHPFKGRNVDRVGLEIPMEALGRPGHGNTLTIASQGVGRLFYRLGLLHAPLAPDLGPLEQGFSLEREYLAVDDPGDVWRDEAGDWHVKAGARVKVRLSMVAPSRRSHVVLVDHLPAGLEALNPALAVTGTLPTEQDAARTPYWWWRRPWYQHQELRDERVEVFASTVWDGIHRYEYLALASTKGSFVVPPPRVEEIYSPETFARAATDRLFVE